MGASTILIDRPPLGPGTGSVYLLDAGRQDRQAPTLSLTIYIYIYSIHVCTWAGAGSPTRARPATCSRSCCCGSPPPRPCPPAQPTHTRVSDVSTRMPPSALYCQHALLSTHGASNGYVPSMFQWWYLIGAFGLALAHEGIPEHLRAGVGPGLALRAALGDV